MDNDSQGSHSTAASGGAPAPVLDKNKRVYMSMWALAMLNVANMAGIGNDVQMAFYGLSSVTYYVVGAIVFFIPTALVAAELATGWAQRGGIFRWVGEGVGRGWAFFCIFLLWFQNALNMAGAPASSAATIMFFTPNYNFAIKFAENPYAYVGSSGVFWISIGWLAFYWILAILSTYGIKVLAKVASWGVILGTIFPLAFMMIFVIVWLAQGNKCAISFNPKGLVPQYQGMSTLALAASVFFSYAGVDFNAAYIKNLKNPKREFPGAMLIAMILSMAIFVFGTLVIAIMVPEGQINVLYSLTTVMRDLGATIGIPWIYVVLAWTGIPLTIASVITSYDAPSIMLGQAGGSGFLPKWLQGTNKHGMPARLVYFQTFLMTVLSFFFMLIPNIEAFIIMLSQALTVLYLLYYVVMFVAYLRLKYQQPNRPRSFVIPGGKVGGWITCIVGIAASLFGIVMSVWPPAQVSQEVGSPQVYVWSIIGITLGTLGIAFGIYWASRRQGRKWVNPNNKFAPFTWEIEGMRKPGYALSDIPTEVMSYGQDPMGMPIKKPFAPDAKLADVPQAVIEATQAEAQAGMD
ncbi:MAG: amino acid permease [Aeriscardovia sp.]|nr:amino acid permease [Aeriscardovia sp.]